MIISTFENSFEIYKKGNFNKLFQYQFFWTTIICNTTAEIKFKPDSEIGIKVEKVFTNSTVKLRFNHPMQPYINPLFTENSNYTTNVTKVLP